jgi:hypothetical protein
MYEDNLFAVDTTGVEKMGGFEIYPAGFYPAIMITANKKPTRDNNGAFIECVYQFIDGDMNGKKFTSRMNLWNANDQAVDIAKRELKSIRVALGLPDTESNPANFINRPLVLNIGVKARKDKPQEMENNLVNIEPYGNAPAVANSAPQYRAPAPHYQPPQRPQFVPQTPPPAFQPNGSAPPPWAAR